MRRPISVAARLVAVFALAAGCAVREAPSDAPALLVGAPPSARAAFEEIARAFKARHGGAGASLMFGAPAELAGSGVAFDVIAADGPDALGPFGGRLIDRRDYASNPVVLVARSGAPPVTLKTLPLTPWPRKIAIADGRSDAVGAAAEAALGRLGLRRTLDPRLLYTSTTELALERLIEGKADLAFARGRDLIGKDGLQIVDRALDGARTGYPIAILSGSPRVAAAREFLDETLHGAGPKAFTALGLVPSASP